MLSYDVMSDTVVSNGGARAASVTLDRVTVVSIVERFGASPDRAAGRSIRSARMSFLTRLETLGARDRLVLRGYK